MSRYHHLSISERESILVMKTKGYSLRKMAITLTRSPSTLSRELKRNPEYSPHVAQQAYQQHRPHRLLRLSDPSLKGTVERLLSFFWSLEQIENRLKLEGSASISFATIYRALDNGMLDPALRTKLRIKYRPYRKGHGGRTGRIPVDFWISDRPDAANNREEPGHWESDTMLGVAGGTAMATHVERKSRFTVSVLIPGKKATLFTDATIEAFRKLPKDKVRSFTVDHGKEFAKHRMIRDALTVKVYFAHEGSPWERGTNENTNGLLRQWFPRRTDLANVSQRQLDDLIALLNMRPRKCLDWRSPFEIFFNQVLLFT